MGHKNIISYCNRPYTDVDDMNAKITEQWNHQVKDKDEVYLLGDFTLATNFFQVAEYIKPLNGKIHLIPGNHDYWAKDKKTLEYLTHHVPNWANWDIRPHMDFVRFNKKKIIMCHYPLESWREDIHLHGHTHGKSNFRECRLDVGWDNVNHRLISMDEVMEMFK